MSFLFKKVCIASDHAGYDLKENIKDFLINKHISIIDFKLKKYFYVTFMAHRNKENVDLETVNSWKKYPNER